MIKYWNKGFIRMKFDQFMMRLFDRLVKYFRSSETLSWYPEFSIGVDDKIDSMNEKRWELEDKIHDQDREIDKLYYYIIDLEERLDKAEERLYWYEPWDEEEES